MIFRSSVLYLRSASPFLSQSFRGPFRVVYCNPRPPVFRTFLSISPLMSPTMARTAQHIYPAGAESELYKFSSRRSVVHSLNGMVASTQPLASEAGQRILKMGGNAADAAVAVAAALNMTEPGSTGIGGDMFCLYFDATTKKVHALNGSGRSAANTSLESVRKDLGMKAGKTGSIPMLSALAATTPGAAAGWVDTIEKFGSGKLSMEQILMPAIELGEQGFPVSLSSSNGWRRAESLLRQASPNFREMLRRDLHAEQYVRAPRAGEIMKNPNLAKTFRTLAAEGKKGFYSGRIAKSIVDVVQLCGGYLSLSDLENHMNLSTQVMEPLSLKFRGQNVGRQLPHREVDGSSDNRRFVELWEQPPNGQGIVALMALGILEQLEKCRKIPTFSSSDHNTAIYLHALIEALRIAFADANWWVSDPDPKFEKVKPSDLLSEKYLAERAALFSPDAICNPTHGNPHPELKSPAQNSSDTVYFSVVDGQGNGMSFINSNYAGFGTCIVPAGCGFSLQNRGANFSLGPPDDHPNIYAPGKRPYHTIIPGLITEGDAERRELHSVFGVMGGFMQPQGHVQVLFNMEVFGMNPQEALDAPRICIGTGMPDAGSGDVASSDVFLEEGISPETMRQLRKLGHTCEIVGGWDREMFGRGQVIRAHEDEDWTATGRSAAGKRLVFSAGSDPRGDGCAMPV